jgi:hypothetical protein
MTLITIKGVWCSKRIFCYSCSTCNPSEANLSSQPVSWCYVVFSFIECHEMSEGHEDEAMRLWSMNWKFSFLVHLLITRDMRLKTEWLEISSSFRYLIRGGWASLEDTFLLENVTWFALLPKKVFVALISKNFGLWGLVFNFSGSEESDFPFTLTTEEIPLRGKRIRTVFWGKERKTEREAVDRVACFWRKGRNEKETWEALAGLAKGKPHHIWHHLPKLIPGTSFICLKDRHLSFSSPFILIVSVRMTVTRIISNKVMIVIITHCAESLCRLNRDTHVSHILTRIFH